MKAARADCAGVFGGGGEPLRLLPFELRFLGRRRPPDRWVIDLSSDGDEIIHPQRYYSVELPEDRLFIPEYFVSLFVEAGWRRQAAPD